MFFLFKMMVIFKHIDVELSLSQTINILFLNRNKQFYNA
jgi:hypothetical protein